MIMKYEVSYIMDGVLFQGGIVTNLNSFITGLYVAVFKLHHNISSLTIKSINA